jgi:hypothetical protein
MTGTLVGSVTRSGDGYFGGEGEVTKCFESEMGSWRINGCDRCSPNLFCGGAGVDAGGDVVGEFAGVDFEGSAGSDWASVDDCDVV